jgi:hypothetical protein
MDSTNAGELALQRARHQRVAQRNLQAFGADRLDHEVGCARAHDRDHVVDAAMRGLHDDRQRDPGLAQARQHAQAIEIRHHQVEHHRIDAGTVVAGEVGERRVAAFGGERIVAETADHVLEQPALHRIVVDNQNALTHTDSGPSRLVPKRGTLADQA